MSATQLQGIHWLIYPCKNGSCGMSPTMWKFGRTRNWPIPFENADFQSIFANSTSTVSPS